jgi:2-keto-3-deoxy-L-rhamnonate aldolase RhmA
MAALPDDDMMNRLRRDELVIGMNVRHSRTSEIGPLLKECGYHWFMLDSEHTPPSPPQAYELLLAANRAGIAGIARARANDPSEIGAHLSNGARGILIPHVDTPEQAARAARSCRFPPVGNLSVPGYFPQLGYQPVPFDEAARTLNERTIVVCMIESPLAVQNADAIAATPGVDILFIGASDFTFEASIHNQYGHEMLTDAVGKVCAAARKHGKIAGMGGPKAEADWRRFIGLGIRMIMTESDLVMLIYRATERARYFQGLR